MTLFNLPAWISLPPAAETIVGFVIVAALAAIPLAVLFAAWRNRQQARRHGCPPHRALRILAGTAGLCTLGVLVYACFIEPAQITVTHLTLTTRKLQRGETLRIAHITDLHFVKRLRKHDRMLALLAAERPELILVTGDLLQPGNSPTQRDAGRQLFREIGRIAPTYMVLGNHERYPPLTGDDWALLRDEARNRTIGRAPLSIIGWEWTEEPGWAPPEIDTDPERVNILLAHSPDCFPLAAPLGIDLALAGHTHGGQVRLPLWGAVMTESAYGKRFEYGHYILNGMHGFVSRGIGENPWPPFQPRFLCPPEIAILTLIAPE